MLREHDIRDLVERLEREGAHRVLRKLEVSEGRTGVPYYGGDTSIAVVLDVETTGLDASKDAIIELAMRRFRYDKRGRILKIDVAYSWLEDPCRPLNDDIVRLTGLTDAGLVGQSIDEETASRLLRSAHLVIAHNAAFDRNFVERRLPDAAGLPWACSMCEVNWAAAGFEGKSLGWLGVQAGWFHNSHRASGDVDAVIGLLSHVLPSGRTVFAELTEHSATPAMRIEATGASFAVKDDLRSRGYRWCGQRKVWWKDVAPSELRNEECWLNLAVYGPQSRTQGCRPRVTEVSARERYT